MGKKHKDSENYPNPVVNFILELVAQTANNNIISRERFMQHDATLVFVSSSWIKVAESAIDTAV